MIKKLERFVSSLTDQEIDCQLKDIFEWARIYKELLETEQAYRRNNQLHSNTFTSRSSVGTNYGHEEVEDAYKYIEPTEEGIEKITVDYELAQMIQQKVSSFSAQKTKEQLEKLRQIPMHTLTPEDLAQLQFEIETCELHLFELTGETADGNNVCPSCGTELEAHAKFCDKCGTAIKGA